MYQTSNSTILPRPPIEDDADMRTLYLNAIQSLEKLITCMKDSQKESGLSSEEESFLSFLEEDLSFKKKETGLILPCNAYPSEVGGAWDNTVSYNIKGTCSN